MGPATQALIVGLWLTVAARLWRRRPDFGSPARRHGPGRSRTGGSTAEPTERQPPRPAPGPTAWALTGVNGRAQLSRRGRTVAVVVTGVGLGALGSWLVPLTMALCVGGQRARTMAQRHRAHAAAQDQAANLASLIELALYGGVSLRRALGDVQPWVEAPLGPALGRLLAQVDNGASLLDELDSLVKGPHPELEALRRLVRGVEQDGAPASAALNALAAEGRLERRHRLERQARRLPVRMLVPLIGGVLPAFVLLAVVPMLAGALAGLRSP